MEERDQLQFLESALCDVQALEVKKTAYAQEQQQFQNCEKELEALKKKAEKEKESKVKSNRTDVESEYSKQLRKVESEISKEETRRQNARNEAVKDRTKMETAGLKAANEALKGNITRILKERNLPRFCGTRFFLFMFSPRGLGEVLQMILVFLAALVLLPLAVTCLIKNPTIKYLVFSLIDLVVIAAYIIVYQKVAVPGKEGINLCHDEMDKIKENEKEIRKIEKSIKKDKDDSRYNLVEHDTELARLNQQKNDIVMKKQAALAEFDTQTAVTIRADVDKAYAPQMAELTGEMARHSEAVRQLSGEIMTMEQEVNSRYTQYLGAKNVTAKALEQKIEEVRKMQAEQAVLAATATAVSASTAAIAVETVPAIAAEAVPVIQTGTEAETAAVITAETETAVTAPITEETAGTDAAQDPPAEAKE